MTHIGWFELPPTMAYYYSKNHPEYQPITPFKPECIASDENELMEFLYPTEKSDIYLPIDIDGQQKKAIFKVTHQTKILLYIGILTRDIKDTLRNFTTWSFRRLLVLIPLLL